MTLSLDMRTFPWLLDNPKLLTKAARKALADGTNTIYLIGRTRAILPTGVASGSTRSLI
jgi:hypothetical protein